MNRLKKGMLPSILHLSNSSHFFDRDTLLHLRFPFSFLLLPVFCFAISQLDTVNWWNIFIIFIILHFFIYPGSNIYNSFTDDDKGSIGVLRNPPPATKKLFYVSIIFDSIGLLLCLLISYKLFMLMLVAVGISKAYSWKKIRLKKYSIIGWLTVMIFQGGYTFLLVNMAAANLFDLQWFSVKNIDGMILSSLLIGASYPLTQVYQHMEDSLRGDMTISYRLGKRGTFIFTGIVFIATSIFAWKYFVHYYNIGHFKIFILFLLPVMGYFSYWLKIVWRNEAFADYTHAMRMAFVSSLSMIICFSVLFFLNQL